MDYEQKYKEANEKVAVRFGGNVAKEIFSDLYESEDEKIRKAIVCGMTTLKEQGKKTFATININDCIAWLEKQNSNVDNANKEYWRGYREGKQEILDKYAELEKQSKQKEKNLVDFKASDWYVSKIDGKIYNTKFMKEPPTNQKRRLEIEKAAMSATGIIEQEEWFIKGAEWSDKNPSCISPEKQGEQKSGDKVEPNDYSSIDPHFGKPIEQKPADKIEQKPAWSEDDENILRAITHTVKNSGYKYCIGVSNETMINWLKSLKNRVQPQLKQEWSEEDENHIIGIKQTITGAVKCSVINYKTGNMQINWLKSFKDKHTWRPSDKQMAALSDFNCTGCLSYAGQGQELINLYNDLKKLKE